MSASEAELRIPGFVDLQVNGRLGVDFSSPDLTAESFARACRDVLAGGTAVFLPTIITSSEATYRRNLALMAEVMAEEEFARRLPGIHAEGPFLSPEPGAIGAHDARHARAPDPGFFDRMQEWARGRIAMLTVAADLPGSTELIRHAADSGVQVALGHHLATEDQLARAADAGACALVHLGNGIPNQLDRHRNPLVAGLADDDLAAMIIPDGHHLPPSLIKIILRTKGVGRVIATSDASPLSGCAPGRYESFGIEAILESDGRLHNPERQCLVGSSATLLECMNYLASLDLLSPEELIQVGYRNPLSLLGLEAPALGSAVRYDSVARRFEIVAPA